MALPKKKPTKTRKRTRASHFALKKLNLSDCPKCKEKVLSHQVCENCGTYKGRNILTFNLKKDKKKKA